MGESCRSCGQELSGKQSGFCPRCLFGTAIAEIADSNEEHAPAWEVMGDYLLDYHFEGELGRGGSGVVYEAREKKDDEKVAVKVLNPSLAKNPEFVERFRREAEVMSQLQHPHVVRVKTWGEQNGLLYLAMEFVEGGDVARLLRKEGKQPVAEAVRLLKMACEGLAYSHGKGILHRDIKPGNLLLDSERNLKVADFGLAKILGRESEVGLTMTNAKMGTPRYMAPEQMKEAGEVDERTDVYSLGVVFYEMVTGKPPGGSFALPSELVAVGEQVDEVVLRAMSDEVAGRYGSVREFRAAILGLEKRRGFARYFVLLAVLAVVVGGAFYFQRDEAELLEGSRWVLTAKEGEQLPGGYPSALEDAHEVALSDSEQEFGVALLRDGSLLGFGANSYGQASPPRGDGFVEIAVGQGARAAHGLALRGDGSVVAWGDNSFGQTDVPKGLAEVEAIATGEFWSAARVDGEWKFWGKREGGEIEENVVEGRAEGRTVVAEKVVAGAG